MRNLIDITGQRFGQLTVIERYSVNNKHKQTIWKCQCDCGNTTIVEGYRLKQGKCKSCGCLRKRKGIVRSFKHGHAGTPLYQKWQGMIKACTYKYHPAYDHNQSKGITVCDEWMNEIDSFIAWALANGYKEGMRLRRKDTNGPFSPDNCFFEVMKKREVMNHG